MNPADVALSKGIAPALDSRRVVRSAVNGQPIGYWTGALESKKGGR